MKVLDLCAGYGGLTMGLGLEPTWYSEVDTHACTAYEHNHPGVKALGDVRDASTWPQADVVVAGFPCQPASSAGRRKGIRDERWLWPHIKNCLGVVQPQFVILENVRGLLTVNRQAAIQEILSDLAALGFDASWGVVRASDTGACHRRERWFCVARAGDADDLGRDWPASQHGAHRRNVTVGAGVGALLPTPTSTYPGGSPERYRERLSEHDGRGGEFLSLNHAVELIATPTTSDAKGAAPGHGGTTAEDVMALLPTLTEWDLFERWTLPMWQQYGPAVARHEAMLGRPAPSPVIDNPRARAGVSLSPRFVEWMMCLPDGWVCDVPDIPRTAQLRLLGNGVVPPQAALAVSLIQRNLP